MKKAPVIDAPRDFRINEMFFSTTDLKGRILSGNDIFVRVSGYARAELIGQPHNIIRHPDMPRAVFRLVWDYLQRGQPVAGLVKNRASDGRYYNVIAFLMPVNGGYLSIRFKPSSELQPLVERLYRRMSDCEGQQREQGSDGKMAMDAAETCLIAELRDRGFASYDDFMRKLLHDELKSRDAALQRERLVLFPPTLTSVDPGDLQRETLRVIYVESQKAYQQINTLYEQLDDLGSLNAALAAKAQMVLQQTKDFRFIAFNAALRAARLGEEARSLGVIADYLGESCGRTATIVAALGERITSITRKAAAVTFSLAAARLQIEMLLSFCAELAASLETGSQGDDSVPNDVRRAMIESLQLAFSATISDGVRMLLELEADLLSLGANSEDLRKTVLTLQVAQVGGLVEATRLTDDDSFTVMFADLRQGIDRTKDALAALNEISDKMQAVARETPAMASIISTAVAQMSRDVHALSTISTVGKAVGLVRPKVVDPIATTEPEPEAVAAA